MQQAEAPRGVDLPRLIKTQPRVETNGLGERKRPADPAEVDEILDISKRKGPNVSSGVFFVDATGVYAQTDSLDDPIPGEPIITHPPRRQRGNARVRTSSVEKQALPQEGGKPVKRQRANNRKYRNQGKFYRRR